MKSQLPLYGTPEVQFFYYLDRITFASSLMPAVRNPAAWHPAEVGWLSRAILDGQ